MLFYWCYSYASLFSDGPLFYSSCCYDDSGLAFGATLAKVFDFELGCGHYSTPLLSSVAKIQGRDFHLITSDLGWAKNFQGDPHQLRIIDFSMWPELSFEDEWGIVLVDHEEFVIYRYVQLLKLSQKAKIVVFHDANCIEEQYISWDPIRLLYRYVYFFDRYFPTTAILSNFVDPSKWFEKRIEPPFSKF